MGDDFINAAELVKQIRKLKIEIESMHRQIDSIILFAKSGQNGANVFNMKKIQKQVANKSETLTKLIEIYNAEVAPTLDGYSGMIIALRYISAATMKTVIEYVKYYSRRQIYRIHDETLALLEKMALNGTQ